MENNELNNKILSNVRNRIVVSNLEKEETMRISKRKQIVSLCATLLIILSSSFITVNAATEGKLVEDIKEKYKEIFTIDYDQSKYKITDVKEEKTEMGNTVSYTLESNDGLDEITTMINVDEMDKSKLTVKSDINEQEGEVVHSLTIEDKK